jgi:lipopolysaccharide export system permease protein
LNRILDRYLLGRLIPAFVFGVGGFVLFFTVFDLFDKLDVFIDHKTPFRLILSYYANNVPFYAILVAPMAMLLSTFLCLGQMARFNEITAMKTAGLSLYRVFLPALLFGVVASLAAYALAEEVMPEASKARRKIYNERIRGRLPRQGGIKLNLNYLGEGGRVYAVRRYDLRKRQLQELVVQEFLDSRLVRRVDAHIGDWVNGCWVFREGVVRSFDGDAEAAAPFDSLAFPEFTETPEDLAKDEVDPSHLDSGELGRYVRKLKSSGRPAHKLETERHLKVAVPLGNLMAVFLAAPLASRLRRGGVALGFGLSMALFMAYIGLVQLGRVLGHAGQVPPLPAAWLGNIVFCATGSWLLFRTPK